MFPSYLTVEGSVKSMEFKLRSELFLNILNHLLCGSSLSNYLAHCTLRDLHSKDMIFLKTRSRWFRNHLLRSTTKGPYGRHEDHPSGEFTMEPWGVRAETRKNPSFPGAIIGGLMYIYISFLDIVSYSMCPKYAQKSRQYKPYNISDQHWSATFLQSHSPYEFFPFSSIVGDKTASPGSWESGDLATAKGGS